MRLEAVVLVRRAKADMGPDQNQRRSRRFRARGVQRSGDIAKIIAVLHRNSVSSVGFEAQGTIFRERDVSAGGQSDVVVVIQTGQLPEP